ncbi:MAG: hypothetical protein ACPGR7_10310 [Flavobacteriaceae bacterium]
MKNYLSLSKIIPFLAIFLIWSCNDDTTSDVDDQEPVAPEARSVRIGFSVPEATEESAGHSYVYDGYTVIVYGVNGETEFTDVNLLTGPFEAQVDGDVAVTIYHPDFVPTALVQEAYFGTVDQTIPSSSQEEVNIALELVQGFVVVVAEDGSENLVNGVTINGVSSDLNTYYYTVTDQVTVYINTTRGIMTGTDDLTIGAGVKYTVDAINTTFTVSFPTFAEPIDGELSGPIQPVISQANVSYFESFKLYNDGTVDIYTGGQETDIFIPAEDLTAGYSISMYDLSGLQASWKTNTGETGFDYTGYTNIYCRDYSADEYRLTMWANGYIMVENTSSGETVATYGDQMSNSNPGTYDSFIEDYGSLTVRNDWVDSASTVGNFIWRAGEGSGTVYITSYEVSVGTVTDPVIANENLLGSTILATDPGTGAVWASTNNTDGSVFVMASALTSGAKLMDYDIASIFNELDVEWVNVTTESGITGYINIYLEDGDGNRARVDLMADGSIYIDAITLIGSLDELLDSYGDYMVRTDYVENKGLKAVNGNFVWRTGDQRGAFKVSSYSVN